MCIHDITRTGYDLNVTFSKPLHYTCNTLMVPVYIHALDSAAVKHIQWNLPPWVDSSASQHNSYAVTLPTL